MLTQGQDGRAEQLLLAPQAQQMNTRSSRAWWGHGKTRAPHWTANSLQPEIIRTDIVKSLTSKAGKVGECLETWRDSGLSQTSPAKSCQGPGLCRTGSSPSIKQLLHFNLHSREQGNFRTVFSKHCLLAGLFSPGGNALLQPWWKCGSYFVVAVWQSSSSACQNFPPDAIIQHNQ